ncbi:MAG: CRTAC1 family protein [Acidobacteria bacterium]|nr:CRTAC1 family protein [Acidobacteriota bacterium]
MVNEIKRDTKQTKNDETNKNQIFFRLFRYFSVVSCLSLFIFTFIACNNSTQPATTGGGSAPEQTAARSSADASPSIAPTPLDPAKFTPVEFTDITQEAGIRFRHHNGAFGKKYLPETNGSGCAFIDYDNDGWQDIILINSMDFEETQKKRRSVLALYHNNQNGTFTDTTTQAGLAKSIYGQGVAIGDYDNDGWDDIFVTALGQNRLFRNLGNGKFADATAKVGLLGKQYFSSSAAFVDYDKDGKLDLYVCNYVEWSPENDQFCALDGTNKSYCTPEKYPGQNSRLYRNSGGKFIDVTENAGMIENPVGKSLGVTILDYNKDSWPDIFVANDTQPNKLWKNNANGTFTDMAVTAGVAFSEEGKARGGMGTDAADIDGSGNSSIVVGNFSNEMLAIFRNQGEGLFIDEAPSSNVGRDTLLSLTFGAFFFDYDLDGLSDIFMANGHVADDINKVQPKIAYAQRPQLFRNEGKRKFTERKAGKPFSKAIVARGAAYGDFDNDGDPDILVTTNGGPAYLLRNDGGNQNRFIKIKTAGTKSNRDGIGAKITVYPVGGAKRWQVVRSGSSYCSQSELPVTFGLGVSERIERVDVEWPSGKVDKLTNVAVNQLHLVKEGIGVSESKPLPMTLAPAPAPSPSPTVSGK